MHFLKLVLLALATAASAAHATPITFTETVLGSGYMGRVPFTNQFVTITGLGDTNTIAINPEGYDLVLSSATVMIGSGSPVTIIDTIEAFDNNSASVAGLEDLTYRRDLLDTGAPVFATYDLNGPVTGTGLAYLNPGTVLATTGGGFIFSSVTGSVTLSMSGSSSSATPEPTTAVLLGTGMLGMAVMTRRRGSAQCI